VGRGRLSGDDDPIDGGVPTPGARRARLATAAASVVLAAAVTVSAVWSEVNALVGLAGLGGITLVVVALVAGWDDALVAGALLLFAAYAVSVAGGEAGLDRAAPLVAAGLLGVVEFGSWSLELRDGAEERPVARVPWVLLLIATAVGSSALVLAVSGARIDAGIGLWVLGAGAAVALLALVAQAASSRR
jgi:hypothetical protein